MNNIMKKGKVKGSILFTVVLVMMVMVVFLMSTLVLTSSANRRSYYTYFETQAQYAAQAALDAVTNSAYTDGEFYDWVVKASKAYKDDTSDTKTKPQVTVNFDGSHIQFTNDVNSVTCEVELADESLVWDELTGAVHKTPAYKITATASVGNGKNRSDYTVVNYIYENYRVDDTEKLPSVSNNAKNKLYTWNKRAVQPDDPLIPGVPKAVYSFGKTNTSGNMQYFGPQYSGMENIPYGRNLYAAYSGADDDYMKWVMNDNNSVGNSVFVSNLGSQVSFNNVFQDYREHSIVYGNMYAAQPGKGFSYMAQISADTQGQRGGQAYNQTPYIYVDGYLDTPNNGSFIIGYGTDTVEGKTALVDGNCNVNLYCGGINIGNGNQGALIVRGDIFMYDPSFDSYWGSGNNANTDVSRLGRFTHNNIARLNTAWGYGNAGGDIYSNNHKLTLDDSMEIPGDLIFTNSNGTLEIKQPITVDGIVLCAGTLTGLDNLDCTTIVTPSYAKVDGVVYNMESVTSESLQKYKKDTDGDGTVDSFDYKAFLYDFYADANYYKTYLGTNDDTLNNVESDAAANLWAAYKDRGYQQALMPFNMRLDEIFGTFYRWDLKGYTEAEARANCEGDAMMEESIATGHIYGYKTFNLGKPVDITIVDRWEDKTEDVVEYLWDNEAQNRHAEIEASGNAIVTPFTQDWGTIQGLPGGSGKWAAIGYKTGETVTYTVPAESHVEQRSTIVVPYTTSRSGNNFVPTYTPITNSSEIESVLGSTTYSKLADFTSGITFKKYSCGNKTGYTQIKSDDLKTVKVGYHLQSGESEADAWSTKDFTNAFVINESCYIDLEDAVTNSNYKFLVDPTNHDSANPLRIVLSGDRQCAAEFVINNTAYYNTDYSDIVASYASKGIVAPKGAVQIFFAEGFKPTNLLQLYMSGLYPYAVSALEGYQKSSGEITIVSNPVYPLDKDGKHNGEWDGLDADVKYSYEYVPNTMIYGEAGATYDGQNGACLNANVSMPYSFYNATNGEQYRATVHYREYYYSQEYTKGNYPCFGIGTVVCAGISTTQTPNTSGNTVSVVYIGDENNSGVTQIIDSGDDTTTNSGKLGNENAEYFSNDHIGAS